MKIKEKLKKVPKGLIVTLSLAMLVVLCTVVITMLNTLEENTQNGEGGRVISIHKNDDIVNPKTKKVVKKNASIWWYTECDSICVFYSEKNDKRGFINTESYKIISDAQYDYAWKFSEGLVAVCKNGKLGFINKKGKLVIDYKFKFNLYSSYVFHDNYCVIEYNDKCGVIDTLGNFIVPQEYRNVKKCPLGFIAQKDEGCATLIDFNGNVIYSHVYDGLTLLRYNINVKTEEGEYIETPIRSDYYKYRVDDKYGLADKNGKFITEPIFADITAISNELFMANIYDYYSDKIYIDNKGNFVE